MQENQQPQPTEGYLERLRRMEMDCVKRWFASGMQVLEIGGASGFQADILASWGCRVLSLDVKGRRSSHQVFYPVEDYDGLSIPSADATFDAVFSSNVLEHARNLPVLLGETRRVLKRDGIAVHVLPSSTWRFWTCVAHYPYSVKWILGFVRPVPGVVSPPSVKEAVAQVGRKEVLKQMLLAPPHGEYPSALSELYYFSKRRWLRVFQESGFDVSTVTGNGLFYTGYTIFPSLSLANRKRLARFLGSACRIFVMKTVSNFC